MTRGLCNDYDPEIFYPAKGTAAQILAAKAVCSGCPVRASCLEYALGQLAEHDWGVWGGTSQEERRQLRLHRRAS
jgi:WhiB family redox-sensing transcriptional regulator